MNNWISWCKTCYLRNSYENFSFKERRKKTASIKIHRSSYNRSFSFIFASFFISLFFLYSQRGSVVVCDHPFFDPLIHSYSNFPFFYLFFLSSVFSFDSRLFFHLISYIIWYFPRLLRKITRATIFTSFSFLYIVYGGLTVQFLTTGKFIKNFYNRVRERLYRCGAFIRNFLVCASAKLQFFTDLGLWRRYLRTPGPQLVNWSPEQCNRFGAT